MSTRVEQYDGVFVLPSYDIQGLSSELHEYNSDHCERSLPAVHHCGAVEPMEDWPTMYIRR